MFSYLMKKEVNGNGYGQNMVQTCIMTENILEGVCPMSFVGMVFYHDGIFVFGDTKASKITDLENMIFDKDRGQISKIFAGKDYVLAYTGNNSFLDADKEIFLENYIPDNIHKNWIHLLEDLFLLIKKQPYDKMISFLVGEKNDYPIGYYDNYVVHYIIITNREFTIKERILPPCNYPHAITIGNKYYTKHVNALFFGNSVKEANTKCSQLLMTKVTSLKYRMVSNYPTNSIFQLTQYNQLAKISVEIKVEVSQLGSGYVSELPYLQESFISYLG